MGAFSGKIIDGSQNLKTRTFQKNVYTSRLWLVKICMFHVLSTFLDMFGDTLGVLWGYFDIVCNICWTVSQHILDVGRKQMSPKLSGNIVPVTGVIQLAF